MSYFSLSHYLLKFPIKSLAIMQKLVIFQKPLIIPPLGSKRFLKKDLFGGAGRKRNHGRNLETKSFCEVKYIQHGKGKTLPIS